MYFSGKSDAMPIAVIYIVAAMLILGIFPLPYGYYILLRLVVCGVFGFAAYITYQRKYNLLPWVFGSMVLLFNPIFKVHFPKEVWMIVDFTAAIFLLFVRQKIFR